jgi:hypothetical protein
MLRFAHLDEISNGDGHGLALCPSYMYCQDARDPIAFRDLLPDDAVCVGR